MSAAGADLTGAPVAAGGGARASIAIMPRGAITAGATRACGETHCIEGVGESRRPSSLENQTLGTLDGAPARGSVNSCQPLPRDVSAVPGLGPNQVGVGDALGGKVRGLQQGLEIELGAAEAERLRNHKKRRGSVENAAHARRIRAQWLTRS